MRINLYFNESKVLIVDDAEPVRDYVFEALSMVNLHVVTAENGLQGIDRAREMRPDLILMDIKMPVMDGWQACDLNKKDPQLKNIPIIAFTASLADELTDSLIEKGFSDHLIKPVQTSSLIGKLTQFLPYTVIEQEETVSEKTEPLQASHELQEELLVLWPVMGESGSIIKLNNIDKMISAIETHMNDDDTKGMEKPLKKLKRLKAEYNIDGIEIILREIARDLNF